MSVNDHQNFHFDFKGPVIQHFSMEDNYFGNKKNETKINNDNSAVRDFINLEIGEKFGTEFSAENSVVLYEPPTIKTEPVNKNEQYKNNFIDTPDSDETADIASIGSGLESDIEDNDSHTNQLNKVSAVKQPDIEDIDKNLPKTVTLLTTEDGSKCYLVGTAHFSIESQNDVSRIIKAVQPHMVMVELCTERIHVLQLDEETILREAKEINSQKIIDTIRQQGLFKGIFYLLLLNMSAYITKVLGLAPGGEFRRALQEANKIPNCVIQMGDRPIEITFSRALHSLSWWQLIKLAWHLMTEKDPFTQEDVEKYKSRDAIEKLMDELAEQFPALKEVFVKERDIYLTHSLQMACKIVAKKGRPARVVGVVGIGHTIGITENWGKVHPSQIPPILSVPPPSLSSRVLKFTVKASAVGAVVYVGYKFIPVPSGIFQSIKSSVEGLFKVTGYAIKVDMDATYHSDEYEHPLSDIMYIVNNIPGPGSKVDDFESEFSVGCSCDQLCKNDCSCIQGTQNYINNRLFIENKNLIIECNLNCTCSEKCGNRLVQWGPLNCLVIMKATNSTMGYGLFSTRLIKKGQFICEYAGEVVGIDEAKKRCEENKAQGCMNYVLVVSEYIGEKKITTCIDPSKFGNIGRYSNHSCQPNTMLVPVRVENMVPKLCLFAIKDIEPMSEITFNYAGDVANSVQNLSKTPCLCGSAVCFGYLPHCPM